MRWRNPRWKIVLLSERTVGWTFSFKESIKGQVSYSREVSRCVPQNTLSLDPFLMGMFQAFEEETKGMVIRSKDNSERGEKPSTLGKALLKIPIKTSRYN